MMSGTIAPPLTVLHIADLHLRGFRAGASVAPKRMALRITDRIKEYNSYQEKTRQLTMRPDMVVCCGDLAATGAPSDYDEVGEVLGFLLDKLGLGWERLFVVPGNHDVNWRVLERPDLSLDPLQEPHQDDAWRWRHDAHKQKFRTRFRGFTRFLRRPIWNDRQPAGDYWYLGTITWGEGVSIHVAGLNSAWNCEKDASRVLLGAAQADEFAVAVRGLVDQDRERRHLVMTAIHHPLECLEDTQADAICNDLCQGSSLLLAGHEHKKEIKSKDNDERGVLEIWTSVGYKDLDDPLGESVGFNLLGMRFFEETVHVRCVPFAYNAKQAFFYIDNSVRSKMYGYLSAFVGYVDGRGEGGWGSQAPPAPSPGKGPSDMDEEFLQKNPRDTYTEESLRIDPFLRTEAKPSVASDLDRIDEMMKLKRAIWQALQSGKKGRDRLAGVLRNRGISWEQAEPLLREMVDSGKLYYKGGVYGLP